MMQCNEIVKELLQSVELSYGSLDNPNYGFMEKRYKTLIRHPFIFEMMSRFFVKNDTDLNDHASLHLKVIHDDGSMMICLSFIDNWAMVFRLDRKSECYSDVLASSSPSLLPGEREAMKLLDQHHFKVVSREDAANPIAMTLFNTDINDARIYHAIIADDGIVPKVLQEENSENHESSNE